MTLIETDKLIEFLPPEPEAMAVAVRRYDKVARVSWNPPGALEAAVRTGQAEATQVNVAGQPAFVLWHNVTPDRRLVVQAAVSVQGKGDFATLIAGVEKLARERNCTAIECQSLRRGMVWQLQEWGFQPTAVVLTKFL
jgi:glycerol-3-phosphate dehydrogenase